MDIKRSNGQHTIWSSDDNSERDRRSLITVYIKKLNQAMTPGPIVSRLKSVWIPLHSGVDGQIEYGYQNHKNRAIEKLPGHCVSNKGNNI